MEYKEIERIVDWLIDSIFTITTNKSEYDGEYNCLCKELEISFTHKDKETANQNMRNMLIYHFLYVAEHGNVDGVIMKRW